MIFTKFLLLILLFSFSLEECHSNCQNCIEYSNNNEDMKCTSCASGLYFIFNTSNCDYKYNYVNYYLNETDNKLYPCSLLVNSNCYECNPYLNTSGKCLSCERGYIYNSDTNECIKCKENEYAIIINNFDGCHGSFQFSFCDKYITYCFNLENENIICPDGAPIFDNLTKSCNEFECKNSNLTKGICYPAKKKYIDRILFINWFKDEPKYIRYPNYYFDNSFLLLELTCGLDYTRTKPIIQKNDKRIFYFYNEEGRGLFNELNDNYEKLIQLDKKFNRFFSTGISFKLNNSEEYRYFLNFESFNYNLELYDIKTGEISYDNIFEIFVFNLFRVDYLLSWIQLLKLNEENTFLMCIFIQLYISEKYEIRLFYITFKLNPTKKEKINVYSLEMIRNHFISNINFNQETRFFVIQTKKGYFWTSGFIDGFHLILIFEKVFGYVHNYYYIGKFQSEPFHKLLFIKDEIFLLGCYESSISFRILIYEISENDALNNLIGFPLAIENYEGGLASDIIVFTETKIIFVVQKFNGKRITIFIIDFFDSYHNVLINKFYLNIYEQKLDYNLRYSMIFKYKDLLGLHIENIEGRNGFVLFGYFNSTDPKQIYNIKSDGLNYEIDLGNYLTLQSNIFEYEKKCIKIVEVPNIDDSGLYLISNITKNIVRKNDCVDFNTKISLYFAHNGIIKKGNYLFKFCGVLEELTIEQIYYYLDGGPITSWANELNQHYFDIYNERRNKNITGRVALVQINVLNDTRVFCDDKYSETSIKDNKGQHITCGKGQFYDIENANEITQMHLGSKYYFSSDKNTYIKCHENCKKCSKPYNDTNMNCDECYNNYFLRDGLCLEISDCEYNYYYDINMKLNCINRDTYCPDFKPFENKITKECIEECDIMDLTNNICGPTNNPISINQTEILILENIKNLHIAQKLFEIKEKYLLLGNNISFKFSTSNIEQKELYEINNSSSIILNDFENILKQKYLIPEDIPIPILEEEYFNNKINFMDINYELFSPLNLSYKLDINSFTDNYIEIRLPLTLKQYKLDLVKRASSLGYNIFDPNDPFYHDICSVFTYNDSDFSLSERKNLLDLKDEKLCISGCNFSGFDIKTIRTICICKIGNNNFSSEMEVKYVDNNRYIEDNENLLNIIDKNFGFSNTLNIKVVKCIKIIFNKDLFITNYGFYIILSMTILNIILIIFSPISEIENKLKKYCLKVLLEMKTVYYKINEESKINLKSKKNNENELKNKDDVTTDMIICGSNKYINSLNIIENEGKDNSKSNSILIEKKSRNSDLISTSKSKFEKTNNSLNYLKNDKKDNEKIKIKEDKNNNRKIIKELLNKNNYDYYIYHVIKYIPMKIRRNYLSEEEIENLSYYYALRIENRNKSEYYFSLLLVKNKLISIFLNDKDYNIQTIKISLFIFNFNLSFAVNALFFTDEAIYEINQDEGSFNLKTQIRRIFYSAVISTVISLIVELLALTHDSIIKLRYYKNIKKAESNISKLVEKMKVKIIIFFGIIIFFDLIFFYYITAFCAIYSIIQIHLISDSLMSFLLTTSYSIILSLISTIMRISSLKKETKVRYVLYILSWIISLI